MKDILNNAECCGGNVCLMDILNNILDILNNGKCCYGALTLNKGHVTSTNGLFPIKYFNSLFHQRGIKQSINYL